jgi:hypothetical protein
MIFVWNSFVADKHNASVLGSAETDRQTDRQKSGRAGQHEGQKGMKGMKGMKVFVQYVRVFIHNFNQNSEESLKCVTTFRYQISWKCFQQFWSCYMPTVGRTDMRIS